MNRISESEFSNMGEEIGWVDWQNARARIEHRESGKSFPNTKINAE